MKRSLSFVNLSDLEENKFLQPDVRKSKSMNSVTIRHQSIEHEALDELLESFELELQGHNNNNNNNHHNNHNNNSNNNNNNTFTYPNDLKIPPFHFDMGSNFKFPPSRITTGHIHNMLNNPPTTTSFLPPNQT